RSPGASPSYVTNAVPQRVQPRVAPPTACAKSRRAVAHAARPRSAILHTLRTDLDLSHVDGHNQVGPSETRESTACWLVKRHLIYCFSCPQHSIFLFRLF